VHGTSGEGQVFHPFQHGDGHMPYQSFGFSILDFTILDFNADRFTAIETDSIDLDRFSRE
jgi:hypothetical protein